MLLSCAIHIYSHCSLGFLTYIYISTGQRLMNVNRIVCEYMFYLHRSFTQVFTLFIVSFQRDIYTLSSRVLYTHNETNDLKYQGKCLLVQIGFFLIYCFLHSNIHTTTCSSHTHTHIVLMVVIYPYTYGIVSFSCKNKFKKNLGKSCGF